MDDSTVTDKDYNEPPITGKAVYDPTLSSKTVNDLAVSDNAYSSVMAVTKQNPLVNDVATNQRLDICDLWKCCQMFRSRIGKYRSSLIDRPAQSVITERSTYR